MIKVTQILGPNEYVEINLRASMIASYHSRQGQTHLAIGDDIPCMRIVETIAYLEEALAKDMARERGLLVVWTVAARRRMERWDRVASCLEEAQGVSLIMLDGSRIDTITTMAEVLAYL